MRKQKETNIGISFLDLLLLLFITLKLLGYINWSWWWVLSPVWGVLAFILIAFLTMLFWELFKSRNKKEKTAN